MILGLKEIGYGWVGKKMSQITGDLLKNLINTCPPKEYSIQISILIVFKTKQNPDV